MTTPTPSLAILDVGHGNSAVVHSGSGAIVIDAGPGSTLLEYLTDLGIYEIDSVLLSHADKDHIEGLVALLSSGLFVVRHVRLNSDALKGSDLWGDLLYELGSAARVGKVDFVPALTTSQTGEFDRGEIGVEILAPSPELAAQGPGAITRNGRRLTSNSISAVIRITKKKKPIALLTADLDDVGLDELIATGIDISAPLVVFPHHGGRPGSANLAAFSAKFCSFISPSTLSIIVFSIGRGLHETPQPEIIAQLRKSFPSARVMCTQLSLHCATLLPNRHPTHLHNSFSRGKEHKKCCAGTLFLDLRKSTRLFPLLTSHKRFISKNATTALCQRESF
jgi:beta-lactamase superfamily II metal-dependent hydrolase